MRPKRCCRRCSRKAVVTWYRVPEYGQTAPNTVQMQLYPTGRVHVSYLEVNVTSNPTLVGYSGGGGAQDPGSTDGEP